MRRNLTLSLEIKIIIMMCFAVSITACGLGNEPSSSRIDTSMMLQLPDFPPGWEAGTWVTREVPNALDSASRDFHHVGSDDWIKIDNQLSLYPDRETAFESLSYWERTYFGGGDWPWPEGFEYDLLNSEDYFRAGCIEVLINSQPFSSCSFLLMHDNRVTLLMTNLDHEVITRDFFRAVLHRVDERMHAEGVYKRDPIVVPTSSH